jgi:NADPH2:quinone reductase
MRRAICREFADPVALEVVEEPDPTPSSGEVLVLVDAASVTFVDGLIARGKYQVKPPLPYSPGMALCGRVAAVGPDTPSAPLVGTPVAALRMGFGCYTTHAVVPVGSVVPLPDGLDPATAVGAIENYSTLLFAVRHRVTIGAGDQVVVLGAGGGIGLAAVDVARSAGARVVAVASSEQKRSLAAAAGAAVTVDYSDLKNSIRSATGGGADIVIDPVGGEAAESALRALGPGGRFCVLGFASGDIPRLPANIVLLRNRSIIGVDWGDWARADDGAGPSRDLLVDLFGRLARGELTPPEPSVARLEDAAAILQGYADRRLSGRWVLQPQAGLRA